MHDLLTYSVNSCPSRKNRNNKLKKQVAREVGIALGSMAVGQPNARLAYKVAAKGVKVGKKVRKFVGSFKKGGRVPATGLALVHKGETVIPRSVGRSGLKLFSQPSGKGVILSDPAMMYLKSFIDPFNQNVKTVGTPRPGSMPSYKVTGFTRGVGYIGLNGMGYVTFAPCLCNDRPCVTYTTTSTNSNYILSIPSDYVLGDSTPSAYVPAVANMSNLPYNYSTLTTTITNTSARSVVEGRIVSASLRAYYTGTTLNSSGQYYGYSDPDFESVVSDSHLSAANATGGYTISSLGEKEACEIKFADRAGMQIIFVPPSEGIADYPANNANVTRKTFPYSNGLLNGTTGYGIGVPTGVICITGVAGQSFYFEAVTHAEYVGPGVPQALLTASYSDTVGYDAVQMLLSRAQRRAASDARKSLRACILEEAKIDGIRI